MISISRYMKLILPLLMMTLMFTSVYAEEIDMSDACVNITGVHKVTDKEELKTGKHTFILTADDASFPMPEGSSNGVKKVTISSNEKFSFGDIKFNRQGTYTYRVSREILKSDTLKEDDSVYHVTISVYYDGVTAVVFEKQGEKGKPDSIEYTDEYVEQGDDSTRTGDNISLTKLLMAFLVSFMVLISVYGIKRERE